MPPAAAGGDAGTGVTLVTLGDWVREAGLGAEGGTPAADGRQICHVP